MPSGAGGYGSRAEISRLDRSAAAAQGAVGAPVEPFHDLFVGAAAATYLFPEEEVGEGAFDLGDGLADEGLGAQAEEALGRAETMLGRVSVPGDAD